MRTTLSRRLATAVSILALPLVLAGTTSAQAQTLTATFTNPTDGATNADMSIAVQWTTLVDAQAYYLYLGTSLGAKDVTNSGELQTTSYQAVAVPAGVTIYGRLWTKVSDVWRYVDITFTAGAGTALNFTYPSPSASSADMTLPFQWTSVANVQAYYLYVGSAAGLKDFVNSGEILTTSYTAYNLPVTQVVYARLWVKVADHWSYIDKSFTVTATASQVAHFVNPTDGAINVDVSQPLTWSTALNADAYYLYVGTTQGAKDLINSGEMAGTSYLASVLPSGQTLYARLWTKAAGVWRFVDISFTAAGTESVVSSITYPTNSGIMDISRPFTWTSVPGVQAYYLYVGTTAGTKNVVDSGETLVTSYFSPNLPLSNTPDSLPPSGPGQIFYARIYAKVGGIWRASSDVAFTTSQVTASLVQPGPGDTLNITAIYFHWTIVPAAEKYYLYVGTTPGAKDLIDTEEICNTCKTAPMRTDWNPMNGGKSPGFANVWTSQLVYVRLWTMVSGAWRYVDSSFSTTRLIPTLTNPIDGATNVSVSAGTTYTWGPVSNSGGYRLTVQYLCDETHSCSPYELAEMVADSGVLTAGQLSYVLPSNLPADHALLIKVYALKGTTWRYVQGRFTAGGSL